MSDVVLDASAIIAVINREPGADQVVEHADGARVSTLIVAEVVTWLALRGTPVEDIRRTFGDFKLAVELFHEASAFAAGLLVLKTKHRGLSLADRACLALAVQRGCPVLTADRTWRDVDVGADVRLIR